MAKISAEYKEIIHNLTKKELEMALAKVAEKREVFDYLLVNYFDKENGEQELFERAKAEIDLLIAKKFTGRTAQHQLSKLLVVCSKAITQFSKNCKQKNLEADLILYVLEIAFPSKVRLLGTTSSTFDSKVAMLMKKLIAVITKKLHEDYVIEYEDKVNEYLAILHKKSNHLNSVYNLPECI